MKYVFLLIFIPLSLISQKDSIKKIKVKKEIVKNSVVRDSSLVIVTSSAIVEAPVSVIFPEKAPEYPGGLSKAKEFIDKNIIKPKNYPKGTVYISFIVDKTGRAVNPKVLKGINAECDKAAVDVINKLQNFKPAESNGKKVDCPFNIPIKFE